MYVPPRRQHPQPDAVLLESHRGFVVEAGLRLGSGPCLGSEEVYKAVDLVVVLAESTNDNGRDRRRPRPGYGGRGRSQASVRGRGTANGVPWGDMPASAAGEGTSA